MARPRKSGTTSSWTELVELAAGQSGYFTKAQASDLGFSGPRLAYHTRQEGDVERVARGIYRFRTFPPTEHEDLIVLWLWSGQKGVFSHETALALHQLSDVLPATNHITVPGEWKARRLKVPKAAVLHFADLSPDDVTSKGNVPVTAVTRTLLDCVKSSVPPEFVETALEQARSRGLASARELHDIEGLLLARREEASGEERP